MFADDMAYEALASLQHTLRQILQRDHDYLTTPSVKGDVISIHDQASVLQLNLNDFPEKETIRERVDREREIDPIVSLSNQLREVAEELESTTGDVVDYCRSINNNSSVYKLRQLSESPVVSSTPTIKDEDPTVSRHPTLRLTNRLGKLAEKILSTARDDLVSNVRLDDSPAVSSSSRPALKLKAGSMAGIAEDLSYSPVFSSLSRPRSDEEDMVGFEVDLMMIRGRLCGGWDSRERLQVLPVVGMGGSGKTMLVNAVYNDASIINHFDIRAWVTISQDYSVGNVLYNLLASLKVEMEPKRDVMTEIDLYGEDIHRHLYGRRYLIVMDDIWSTNFWDDVQYLFPDNKNGSRIIFTTRLLDVAAAHADYHLTYHKTHLLDEEQSWSLFKRKVFADQTCPDELQGVGRKIVKSCGGLPLAIVRVAQLLSSTRINRNPKSWEQVVATDGQLVSILSRSYSHLPHHLKACFLYMAAFPEDYEIRVSELIKLWVAEGFLEERPYVSLEKTARQCLIDLIENSLVLASSWNFIDGKIKSCRLQNMMRVFCARQAVQERLLLPVMDYLPTPILRRHFLPQVLRNHQRLSVSWCDLDLKDSTHSSCTKSIICIPEKGYKPKGSVRNFSSLRVLHVSRRKDHSYWELELGQVFDLIHLTYLASNIPTGIVPPAISKLQNLQTLIIYRSGVRLPVEIWRMRRLRHLVAFSFDPLPHPDRVTIHLPLENYLRCFPIGNLKTLSLATNLVCSMSMVFMIRNIKKLGICYSGEKFDEDYHLNNLVYLRQLEKLKLEVHSSTSIWPSLNPVFPKQLENLTLSGCRLPWRDMTIVGSLPNLQVLKLRDHACDGERWETTEGEFDALRFLLIDESNLQHWITQDMHFPMLKHLVLHRCPHLTEIPMEVGEIPTLELIEVDDRNQSLLNSAKMIREERIWSRRLQVRVKSV